MLLLRAQSRAVPGRVFAVACRQTADGMMQVHASVAWNGTI